MRNFGIVLIAFLFANCELTNYVPPVTPQMTAAIRAQHTDLVILSEGRVLFAHRCIECHALPAIRRYSADAWPDIVDSMSDRASLKPVERDAIVVYIRAVRGDN